MSGNGPFPMLVRRGAEDPQPLRSALTMSTGAERPSTMVLGVSTGPGSKRAFTPADGSLERGRGLPDIATRVVDNDAIASLPFRAKESHVGNAAQLLEATVGV